MNIELNHPFHAREVEGVPGLLEVRPESGLTLEEVSRRRDHFGQNVLTPKKKKSAWVHFLLQFHQPLIYILLVAALVTFLIHEWVESGVIFAVVIVNAIVGFIQEAKALKALDALSQTLTTKVQVVREKREATVDSVELVPGDVVLVRSGDKVGADLRVLESRELTVNESALTGESLPVQKKPDMLDEATVLNDRDNMLYASTLVTYGSGRGVVTATGDDTEVGRISGMISGADDLQTPLTIKINEFSHKLVFLILGLGVFTFLVGMAHGQSLSENFLAVVALAVGAIPEGLPAAVTITLAIGVSRMAKRKAIIRKLPAVETLGSTSVICSDKTGTLTENQMTVQRIWAGSEWTDVEGVGYGTTGSLNREGSPLEGTLPQALEECLRSGLLCNETTLVEKEGRPGIEGDPTEGALVVSATKAGLVQETEKEQFPRLDTIPFESEYQYMATLHRTDKGECIAYLKGSVEAVLARCETMMDREGGLQTLNPEAVTQAVEAMAVKGLRVLSFARKEIPQDQEALSHEDVAEALVFLGLQGMIDPPRPEAIDAVKECHAAGIRVKMITGDHALTASAIARKLGLRLRPDQPEEELQAVSGKELGDYSDEALVEVAEGAAVFARVTPEQKLRLVRALQSKGNIVAMTGDGVNDAPALKQANIGVAMGITGTEVSKEAADMVLLDDNFASIEAAVEEGRCVFDNLKKFIVWTLPTNLGEGLAILTGILFGTALPIMPVQILWVNMTTAICLGLMLVFEPREPGIMRRPPRDPRVPLLTRDLVMRILFVGFLLLIGIFGLFLYEWKTLGYSLEHARTTAVTVLVFGEMFYLFNCRSLDKNMFQLGIFSNRWILGGVGMMILLQGLFIYSPWMNRLFGSSALSGGSWARILTYSLLIYLLVSFEKFLRSRRERENG